MGVQENQSGGWEVEREHQAQDPKDWVKEGQETGEALLKATGPNSQVQFCLWL